MEQVIRFVQEDFDFYMPRKLETEITVESGEHFSYTICVASGKLPIHYEVYIPEDLNSELEPNSQVIRMTAPVVKYNRKYHITSKASNEDGHDVTMLLINVEPKVKARPPSFSKFEDE